MCCHHLLVTITNFEYVRTGVKVRGGCLVFPSSLSGIKCNIDGPLFKNSSVEFGGWKMDRNFTQYHFSTTLIFQNLYFWTQISVLKKTDRLGYWFSVLPISWVSRRLVICTEKQVMGHFHNGTLATWKVVKITVFSIHPHLLKSAKPHFKKID